MFIGRDGISPGRTLSVVHERIVSVNLAGKSRPALGEREAIPLLGGRALVTLEDAARYIQNLPRKSSIGRTCRSFHVNAVLMFVCRLI